ncbi:sigma-54-dependent transcriptional regulator [Hyalangium rubrum]|uniref:Sigma-54 dependent transcriptional regulator n=1 Tax=Hyalangium rubrum TaxID=3103134 RepID=A0ABU5H4L4_9BACT|nr:sigma-54 dependent transcriptional regulator [Hyalangium sp. s54d21]MDY7227758.1 sigma-54 dependent transcriptional regulator [Hyalangium sp. s54d21]
MAPKVLVVDDDVELGALISVQLRHRGFEVATVTGADAALARLTRELPDVLVTDLQLIGGPNGIELCRQVAERYPELPIVLITAHGSIELAVAAIRAGAYDFITKPLDFAALALTLERAVQLRALREEVSRLRRTVDQTRRFEDLLGTSAAMREVYGLLDRVATADISVLITGESGTGKELVARALHQRSRRKDGPLVAINCSALPEALLESELFGHVKGAFTDARSDKPGLFVQAHGGTLFLDEVGELPLGLQPKLLRALQERKVRPVGATAEQAIDVRVVSATNVDLEEAVQQKRFRQDLFFRLNVVHVPLPPLRDRGGDVLLLAQRFLEQAAALADKKVAGLSDEAAERLLAYSWPGNVRELQNCIERAVALTASESIAVRDLPEKVRQYRGVPPSLGAEGGSFLPLHEVERRHILSVLEALGGNKSSAATVLGVDRRTLYRKLAEYRALSSEDAADPDAPAPPRSR